MQKLVDSSGVVRFVGRILGLPTPPPPEITLLSGFGPPLGVVTPPDKGALYADTHHGALFVSYGTTDNDWFCCGGDTATDLAGVGTTFSTGNRARLVSGTGEAVTAEDGRASISVPAGRQIELITVAGRVMQATDDGAGQMQIGFFEADPINQQTLDPLTATPAQIVQALINVGLAKA